MSSRESDSANPQPRRSGPDAYPSGTPPYGTGLPGGLGADPAAGRTAPGPRAGESEVPKTETTLTTRVRINIPGSRPIPPVVVRSQVKDDKPAEPAGPRHRGGAGDPVLGVMDSGARTATPPNLPPEWQEPAPGGKPAESDSTGEWFKPRQKGRQEPAPAAAAPAPPGPAAAAREAAPRPSGAPASPFAPPAEPAASRTGQTPLPAQPDDPFRAAASADPFAAGPQGAPQPDPFAQADPFGGPADSGRTDGRGLPTRQGGRPDATRQGGRPDPAARGPVDPFSTAPAGRGGAAPKAPFPGGQEPEDTQIGGFDPITGEEREPNGGIPDPPTTQLFLNASGPGGAAPAADPFAQERPRPAAPGGGRFADVPEAQPFPGGSRAATPKRPDAPVPPPESDDDDADEPKKRGRARKLAVTAFGALVFAGAAAYGAGLMMNQSDIPKGTTVLGTAIGGDSRDQAVTALDGTVGKAGQQPLKLKIGDQSVALDPASAGLSFDTTATVDSLTKHSYNPVEVVGALTGTGKAVAPQVRVDKSKLRAALDDLAGKSGQGLQEGFVRFTDAGTTEVVPGKAGQALDSAAAADQVEQAYRDRAAGKPDAELALNLTAAQPKVGQDVLQAAADSLGKQVLNGNITVVSGTKQFLFGKGTAAKALVLAPDASGQVVLKWDLAKLDAAIGTTFDKLKFTKNGQQSPITAQDVADGIGQVIGKSGKDRTYKFPA
ncbi:peptidoglycan binding domain-containing protein [Kitasatospora sp. NPDC049285]|uniref:peptidoglycan binding domain-containing protein n=1 Tax=Kitasatospora sp. NPDC049285 TaxID=3157096 RepID=UPI0034383E2B